MVSEKRKGANFFSYFIQQLFVEIYDHDVIGKLWSRSYCPAWIVLVYDVIYTEKQVFEYRGIADLYEDVHPKVSVAIHFTSITLKRWSEFWN